ncbi:PEP-utilizing enzyme [Sphaerisporangium siamense]|uniref:Pyruvate,water dikinase n=1 Tax=Sphaerisporangium siamense TaxID=795645 RepID=A0A7W7D7U1_9ACTN|nr:PEP-utilizing enzyme [Sphaerisporangium siamense]MBB4701865.1 pyruvate,water dikinase [Sphaerisporangium siamense]
MTMSEAGSQAGVAPGPGRWVLETAHQARPFTRFFLGVWLPVFAESMPAGFRRYGLLLERLDMRLSGIWKYVQARQVVPWRDRGPAALRPARQLAWRLHPEVRGRARAARRALASRAWREEAAEWFDGGLRARFVARNRALQAVPVDDLDEAALRGHIDELIALLHDGDMVHMRHLVAQNVAVGDWLAHVRRWTGVDPADALAVLRGASPASVRPLAGLDRLVAAVRAAGADPGAAGPPEKRLEAVRAASPEAAAALEEYLGEHGDDLLGFDLDEPTLREMPALVLAALEARLSAPAAPPPGGAADPLRARVPERHRAEYDRLLDDARLLYGLRDDDVAWTEMRPWGLLRRALLAAGRRLVARSALENPEHAVEADPAELAALLSGADAPTAAELAERATRRRTAARPPLELGEEEPAMPLPRLPAALARVNDALLEAMSQDLLERAVPSEPTDTEVHGTPASPGVYTGRARIVRGPAEFGRLEKGDVLVAPTTGPSYNVVLPLIGAVVTDRGGALSHAAVVAREFGVPAVVGTRVATQRIRDGELVRIDGARGVVTVL